MKKSLPPAVYSMQFTVLLAYSSLAVLNLLPMYFEHLGGTPRRIGLLVGVFSLASFFSRPLGGWLLNRFPPKKVLGGGLFLFLFMTPLYFGIRTLAWPMFLIRILHGVGFSVFIIAALYIVILAVKEGQSAYAIGVVSTGFMLPLLIAPYIGEQVILKLGFPFYFLLAGVLAFIPLVYILSSRLVVPWSSRQAAEGRLGFLQLLRRKRIFVYSFLAFLFEVGLSSTLGFVPLLALEGPGLRAGYFFTFLGLTAVFIRLYVGKKMKSWGKPGWIVPAFGLLCVGGLALYFSTNNLLLALSGMVMGAGAGILYPHLTALSVEGLDPDEKSMVLSIFASAVDLGFAVGPILFGVLSQFLGIRLTFIPVFVLVMASTFILVIWGREFL